MSKSRRTKKQKVLAELKRSKTKLANKLDQAPVLYKLKPVSKQIRAEQPLEENPNKLSYNYVLTDIKNTSIALGIISLLNFITYFILKNNIIRITNLKF